MESLYQKGYENGRSSMKRELEQKYKGSFKPIDYLIERSYNDLVRRKVLMPSFSKGMRNTVLAQINVMRSDLHQLHSDLCNMDVSDNTAEFLNFQESTCQIVADALAICKLAYIDSNDILKKMDVNDSLQP